MDKLNSGIAFTDGAYGPADQAKLSLLDWGFLRSDANQDTVTVWKGAFFRLDDHLARFARNIAKLRMTGPYTPDERRQIVVECVRRSGLRQAYVQMIMTRGRPPIGSRDPRLAENRFHVFCIPYVWIATPEQKAKGLRLHVSERRRVPPESVDPTIKHFHWLEFEMGLFEAYDAGADTVVLGDGHGNITEGPGFNIFAVKDGALTTPEAGVLDGMTRRTVFELCDQIGIAYSREVLPRAHLAAADEVFLTTSGGGLIPITVIDGTALGDGTPGPLTTRLDGLYWSKREAGWHATPVDYEEE